MPSDVRPVALIPAYKPTPAVLDVAQSILESGQFQAVVCVDDGSGEDFAALFDSLAALNVTVLRHYVNLGKGMALRTGLNAIACAYPDAIGVVTIDADGQHMAKDVIEVGKALQENPGTLIMGCRSFGADVPLRSRFGNIVTRHVMRLLAGIDTRDTQSGLRGIPRVLIPRLLRLSTSGYDFELDMLMSSHALRIGLKEIPISTIYIDDNESSHFRPLLDSLAIYFVLLRHTINAVITAVLDYIAFACMLALGYPILTSMIGGRAVAGLFNFFVGKTLVFKSRQNIGRELLRYVSLVIALILLSYGAIVVLVAETEISPFIAKLIVELSVFFLSFAVQRVFVFGGGQDNIVNPETDWNTYYRRRTTSGSPTRKITERLLLSQLSRHANKSFQSITEFGGGDSCFYAAFRRHYPDAHYSVVDKSKLGIEKFLREHQSPKTAAIEADILTSANLPKAELVYSVGLIEHFDAVRTASMIKAHFDAALPGGFVLITYPTPTLSYRLIRGAAEFLGIWRFPDERPLLLSEVESEMKKYGIILSKKMNWYIGLTQQIIIARKS